MQFWKIVAFDLLFFSTISPHISILVQAIYLHELTAEVKAERIIGEWIDFYNTERPHSSFDSQTPAEAYSTARPMDMMDKLDGLPTSPQDPQQQQDMINKILAA